MVTPGAAAVAGALPGCDPSWICPGGELGTADGGAAADGAAAGTSGSWALAGVAAAIKLLLRATRIALRMIIERSPLGIVLFAQDSSPIAPLQRRHFIGLSPLQ